MPTTATMTDNVLLAFCTCPDVETADDIASNLVERGLAACVNQLPGITSVYRWEGKIARDSEVLLLIKTTSARFEAMAAWIDDNHPYDTPEVIALPITAGTEDYLQWVHACTTADA